MAVRGMDFFISAPSGLILKNLSENKIMVIFKKVNYRVVFLLKMLVIF